MSSLRNSSDIPASPDYGAISILASRMHCWVMCASNLRCNNVVKRDGHNSDTYRWPWSLFEPAFTVSIPQYRHYPTISALFHNIGTSTSVVNEGQHCWLKCTHAIIRVCDNCVTVQYFVPVIPVFFVNKPVNKSTLALTIPSIWF